jgi:hypothetical protein
MLKGRLRRSLSLKVRITERITREREMVKEFTLKDGEATTLGLRTKSGLRPNSRYKPAYIHMRAAV